LILLGVPPLGGYNYITPRRAGLSATAGLSCISECASGFIINTESNDNVQKLCPSTTSLPVLYIVSDTAAPTGTAFVNYTSPM